MHSRFYYSPKTTSWLAQMRYFCIKNLLEARHSPIKCLKSFETAQLIYNQFKLMLNIRQANIRQHTAIEKKHVLESG